MIDLITPLILSALSLILAGSVFTGYRLFSKASEWDCEHEGLCVIGGILSFVVGVFTLLVICGILTAVFQS